MKILIIEPYFTGSHAEWAEGYKRYSQHEVEILSLEGRNWKWRMHGGAVTLARDFIERAHRPDLILATDMLDLTTFLTLTRALTSTIPVAVYFHENQLTYPWSPGDRDALKGRDRHYCFINYTSALTADRVFFNSRFHMDSFFAELPAFLSGFPDHNETSTVQRIRESSRVLYLGLDLKGLDQPLEEPVEVPARPSLILWNHRWEHDKNPEEFFQALYALDDRGVDFEVALLGESFTRGAGPFEEAKRRLEKRIVHFGFVKDRSAYAAWLRRADILPVTSRHDFFGSSVVEAIYCGARPILPNRLAYPEHIPPHLHTRYIYGGFEDLVGRLEQAVSESMDASALELKAHVARYDWADMAPLYDEEMEKIGARSVLSVP